MNPTPLTHEGGEPLPTNYSIRDKNQLLDMLMKCQAGEMTCLRAIEYIEPQVDELLGEIDRKTGVLDAIDRALDGTTNEEQLARFQQGFIHASRAIAIKNIHSAHQQAVNERCALLEQLEACKGALQECCTQLWHAIEAKAYAGTPLQTAMVVVKHNAEILLASPPARPATQPDKKEK